MRQIVCGGSMCCFTHHGTSWMVLALLPCWLHPLHHSSSCWPCLVTSGSRTTAIAVLANAASTDVVDSSNIATLLSELSQVHRMGQGLLLHSDDTLHACYMLELLWAHPQWLPRCSCWVAPPPQKQPGMGIGQLQGSNRQHCHCHRYTIPSKSNSLST